MYINTTIVDKRTPHVGKIIEVYLCHNSVKPCCIARCIRQNEGYENAREIEIIDGVSYRISFWDLEIIKALDIGIEENGKICDWAIWTKVCT